jgi:hypothetical protein
VFVEFLQRLLTEGSVVLTSRPVLRDEEKAGALDLLSSAFSDALLDVAGPPIAFDGPTALAAAQCVGAACWFLVSRTEQAEAVSKALTLPTSRDCAAAHFSADITLRFLPAVHRRARALACDDVLTRCLVKLLRAWPLAGARADVAEAPLTATNFGGHPGLMLLYAERLAGHSKPAWIGEGPARAHIEWVFAERGLHLPAVQDREVNGGN